MPKGLGENLFIVEIENLNLVCPTLAMATCLAKAVAGNSVLITGNMRNLTELWNHDTDRLMSDRRKNFSVE